MSRVCVVTGKRPKSGNKISHSNRKTRRRQLPNIHERRFWVPSENRWVSIKVSAAGIRTINKRGIDAVVRDMKQQGVRI
ncbi:MAG: 50S ribosomal protein L28 [Myxococcota bacterium]